MTPRTRLATTGSLALMLGLHGPALATSGAEGGSSPDAGTDPEPALRDDESVLEEPSPPTWEPPRPELDFRRQGHTGVGLAQGTFLTGLSIKHVLAEEHAVQVLIGAAWGTYRYWSRLGVGLAFDYVHHPPTIAEYEHLSLTWNVGVGAHARVRPEEERLRSGVGVHALAGFGLVFADLPIDLVFEYRPGVFASFGDQGGLAFAYGDVGLHLRWWTRTGAAGGAQGR